jgi:hypothetical protein
MGLKPVELKADVKVKIVGDSSGNINCVMFPVSKKGHKMISQSYWIAEFKNKGELDEFFLSRKLKYYIL